MALISKMQDQLLRGERAERQVQSLLAIERSLRVDIERLRAALSGLVEAFVNPGDGGPFEAGEVPALDRAREALAHEQSKEPTP